MNERDQQLVSELAKRGAGEIAQIALEANRMRKAPPPPPREKPRTFQQDHGPAVVMPIGTYVCPWFGIQITVENWQALAADGWTLRKTVFGPRGDSPPADPKRVYSLKRYWHHLRVEEAQKVLDDFKAELKEKANRLQPPTSGDYDRINKLKAEVESRQAAFDEFLTQEREEHAKRERAKMERSRTDEKNRQAVALLHEDIDSL